MAPHGRNSYRESIVSTDDDEDNEDNSSDSSDAWQVDRELRQELEDEALLAELDPIISEVQEFADAACMAELDPYIAEVQRHSTNPSFGIGPTISSTSTPGAFVRYATQTPSHQPFVTNPTSPTARPGAAPQTYPQRLSPILNASSPGPMPGAFIHHASQHTHLHQPVVRTGPASSHRWSAADVLAVRNEDRLTLNRSSTPGPAPVRAMQPAAHVDLNSNPAQSRAAPQTYLQQFLIPTFNPSSPGLMPGAFIHHASQHTHLHHPVVNTGPASSSADPRSAHPVHPQQTIGPIFNTRPTPSPVTVPGALVPHVTQQIHSPVSITPGPSFSPGEHRAAQQAHMQQLVSPLLDPRRTFSPTLMPGGVGHHTTQQTYPHQPTINIGPTINSSEPNVAQQCPQEIVEPGLNIGLTRDLAPMPGASHHTHLSQLVQVPPSVMPNWSMPQPEQTHAVPGQVNDVITFLQPFDTTIVDAYLPSQVRRFESTCLSWSISNCNSKRMGMLRSCCTLINQVQHASFPANP
jgi:hypothetical protein